MARFEKGKSGNPGGRPSLAKAWETATGGKKLADVTAEALRIVWEVFTAGPGTSGKFGDPNDPNWRFAAQKVLEYSAGRPKEVVEVLGDSERRRIDWSAVPVDERRALLAAITRLKLITDDGRRDESNDGPVEH